MDTSKPKNWNPSPQPWVRNCLKRSFWNFGPKPMSTMTESWITMNSSKWWRSIDWTTQLHYLSWSEFKTCLWYQRIGSSIVTLCIQHRKSTKIKYYRDSNKVAYLSYHHLLYSYFSRHNFWITCRSFWWFEWPFLCSPCSLFSFFSPNL